MDDFKIEIDGPPGLDGEDQHSFPYGGSYDDNYGSTGGHYPTVPTPANEIK